MNLAPVRAKANAHYTCQECGSTELIQAHHEILGDDNSLIVLCAECHSKRHPDLPKALFFNKNSQPYWHNKSASSLAREMNVHSRTIIRTAKKLGILPNQDLSHWDEELIRNNIPKLQRKLMPKKVKRIRFPKTCDRCGYSWQALNQYTLYCPHCGFSLHPFIIARENVAIKFETDQLMPIPKAAEVIGVHFTTLYRQIIKNKLPAIRIGNQIYLDSELVKEMAKKRATLV